MKIIQLIVSLIPDSLLEELNSETLNELDKRGLIIWEKDLNSQESN